MADFLQGWEDEINLVKEERIKWHNRTGRPWESIDLIESFYSTWPQFLLEEEEILPK